MKIIEIQSIRRSGHHALANWLINNLLDRDGSIGYCTDKYNIINDGEVLWVNEAEYDLNQTKKVISINKPNYVFLTYEVFLYKHNSNSKPHVKDNINSLILTPYLEEKWGVTSYHNYSFVREFWNNFASLFTNFPFYQEGNKNDEVQQWVNYYKTSLKYNYETNGGVFDLWIQNSEYANEISNYLINKDNKLNPLNITGTKSSFKNSELTVKNLLNRSQLITFPDWFIEMVNSDEELLELLSKQQLLICSGYLK
jgi:hypothetical protein